MRKQTRTPFTKTATAADFLARHARSPLTRDRAAMVTQAIAAARAAADPVEAAQAESALLAAVHECAGRTWLHANTDDPDVAEFLAILHQPTAAAPVATGPTNAPDLDELTATVLWAAHGPAHERT